MDDPLPSGDPSPRSNKDELPCTTISVVDAEATLARSPKQRNTPDAADGGAAASDSVEGSSTGGWGQATRTPPDPAFKGLDELRRLPVELS